MNMPDGMGTDGRRRCRTRSAADFSARRFASDGSPMLAQPLSLPLNALAFGAPALARPAENVRVPEPLRSRGVLSIDLGDRQARVLAQLAHPRVVLFGSLLSGAECDALVALAQPKLARSRVVDPLTGRFEDHFARTSEGTYFAADEHPLISAIDQRIARLLDWPAENGEPLQILRYGEGGEYRPHHDYLDPAAPGATAIGGNRVATLILYLQSCGEGGWTDFPEVGFQVAPRKGHALFFSYPEPSPDTKTLHAGLPVIAGEKWIATRWLRQGPYRI